MTHAIRNGALGVQAVSFAIAAAAASMGASTAVVAAPVLVGLTALMLIPPTTAALLPQVVQSADGLVRSNLWVSYCDSASGLVGPLIAGFVVAIGGVPSVFAAGCAGAIVGLAATNWRVTDHVRAARGGVATQPTGVVRRSIRELRSNPWGRGILVLLTARNVMLGSLDVLLVILALESLDLGESGAGYLGALVGAGALASTVVTTIAVRRARLRPSLMLAVTVPALLAVILGIRIERPIVFVVLPVIGLAIAVIDALSRALLVRVTDPRSLAPTYASLAVVAGLGQIVGSAIAQVVLRFGDILLAFVAVGIALALLAALSIRSLRHADEHANIPVVQMSLLSSLPLLSALPSTSLERVARSSEIVEVAAGERLLVEGDSTESCYVVSDGDFIVSSKGKRLGVVARGDVVGEVALLSRLTPLTSVVADTPGTVLRIERQSFLLALTGRDVDTTHVDLADARDRFRIAVASHERFGTERKTARPDTWLGLGAAGRLLGEPSYTGALVQTAELAEAAGNEAALAEAAALATWPGAFFFIADNPDYNMIELCERALLGLDREDPVRVRVLATLASNLAFAGTLERRQKLIDEAHELVDNHDDAELAGAVLNAEFISMWEPGTFERRKEIGPQLIAIGDQVGDVELQYVGRFFVAFCAAEAGSLNDAHRALTQLRELGTEVENEYFNFLRERLLLAIDIAQGCSDVQDRIDALAQTHADTYADTDGTWALQVGGLAYQAGQLGAMVPTIAAMMDGPHARTWRSGLALAHFMAGDDTAAAEQMSQVEEIPHSYFWLTATQANAEVAANLGDLDRCAEYYEQLLPFRGQVGVTASGTRLFGLVSRSLGELALVLGRRGEAVELLREAIVDAESAGMPFEITISRRLLAQSLAADGQVEQARQVTDQAIPLARERRYAHELALLMDVAR